jgi:hypothetical protein
VHRAESASDILGSMFYAQQQGAGLGLPGPLPGASTPFPPPFQHQQQQQQQQQQQRQQNQLAQWSMLQGAMRGASQVSVNPTNSANSANSANSVASLASWLPSPQQQPRPSRPHQVSGVDSLTAYMIDGILAVRFCQMKWVIWLQESA